MINCFLREILDKNPKKSFSFIRCKVNTAKLMMMILLANADPYFLLSYEFNIAIV